MRRRSHCFCSHQANIARINGANTGVCWEARQEYVFCAERIVVNANTLQHLLHHRDRRTCYPIGGEAPGNCSPYGLVCHQVGVAHDEWAVRGFSRTHNFPLGIRTAWLGDNSEDNWSTTSHRVGAGRDASNWPQEEATIVRCDEEAQFLRKLTKPHKPRLEPSRNV